MDSSWHSITTEHAIHPDVVIKENTSYVVGNVVDILPSGKSTDFVHPGSGEALPVETLLFIECGKIGPTWFEKRSNVRRDVDSRVQKDNGGGYDESISKVAIRLEI